MPPSAWTMYIWKIQKEFAHYLQGEGFVVHNGPEKIPTANICLCVQSQVQNIICCGFFCGWLVGFGFLFVCLIRWVFGSIRPGVSLALTKFKVMMSKG